MLSGQNYATFAKASLNWPKAFLRDMNLSGSWNVTSFEAAQTSCHRCQIYDVLL